MNDGNSTTASISTTALFNNLFKSDSLDEFMKTNADELHVPKFNEYITELCNKRGEVPERVISRGNIESSFGHQIFNGRRNPSRDTVIQFTFGFEADYELAQTLLKYAARNQLYPRVKRDAVIIYCLHNHLSLLETQDVLHGLDLPIIGGNNK